MVDKLLRVEKIENWDVDQDTGHLRFYGRGLDGSIRFSIDELGTAQLEKLVDGAWQKTELSLASGTLYLGYSLGISTMGANLSTEHRDGTKKSVYAFRRIEGTGDAGEVQIIHMYDYVEKEIIQSDDSSEFIGTDFNYSITASQHIMLENVYYRTGSTAATEPVNITVHEGTDDTGPVIWKWNHPASDFAASSEIKLTLKGLLEYTEGIEVYVTVSSAANFSLKTDGAGNPWRAINRWLVSLDQLLVTGEWEERVYTRGEWFIDHDSRKIYVCNVTGLQTVSFAANSDKWDELTADEVSTRNQTTGLLEGGVISQASSTTIDWTSGRGVVVDYSDPEVPVVNNVTWDAVTSFTPTNIAIDGVTILGYDKDGNLSEILATDLVLGNAKDYIFFGSINHFSGVIISVLTAPGNVAYRSGEAFNDFVNLIIGPANVQGNIYGYNGVNMNIDVVGGAAFMIGSNFRNNPKLCDIVNLASASALSFNKIYRQADPSESITFDGAATTVIDPSQYDNGSGTLQSVTTDYWTIQRIFRSRAGITFVAYGQQEFASKALALDALGNEPFEEKSPLSFMLFRCSLLVKEGATDLSDTDQAEFFEQSSFRVFGAQSAASTIPGITVPGGNDRDIQFNDAGTFGGSDNFKYTESSGYPTVTFKSASATGGASIIFNNSSSFERLGLSFNETLGISYLEAVSNNLKITTQDTLTFEHGSSSIVLQDTSGNNSFSILSSASNKDVNFNIKDHLGNIAFKVEHNDVSGQTSLDIRNDAGNTKFAITYNSTLDDIFMSSGNGADFYLTSANLLSIRSNNNIYIEAFGNYTIDLINDQATFTVGNSTSNYALTYTNTLDNTVPIAIFEKTGTNGGTFKIFASTVAPEGVVPGTGGNFCAVNAGASSEIYLKTTDTGNTGWQKLLHGASGIQGPGTSTDNSIPTWDGTTGLSIQDNPLLIYESTASSSSLSIQQAATGTADLFFKGSTGLAVGLIQSLGGNIIVSAIGSASSALELIGSGDLILDSLNSDIIAQNAINIDATTVSGSSTLNFRSSTDINRLFIKFDDFLDRAVIESVVSTDIDIVSSNRILLEASTTIGISNTSGGIVTISNDESSFSLSGSTGGYSFAFSNTEPNTEPLLVLSKDDITGGTSRIYISNTTPEGAIPENGGGLCIVSADADSNIYLKLNNGTSTTWQSLLGDVIGPASSTDSVLALFDGTTGKLLKSPSLITVSEASDTELRLKSPSATLGSQVVLESFNGSRLTLFQYNETSIRTTLFLSGSSHSFRLDANGTVDLRTLSDDALTLNNDNASYKIYGSAQNYRHEITNNQPNTNPLIRLIQSGLNGGTFDIIASTVAPEGVIPSSGGGLCVKTGANADIYLKRTDTGNTGWVDLLHAASGVQGPGTTTDNAIAVWDGADGLTLQNSYSSLVSTASSTLLSIDNVLATGDSGFQIRNNAQNVRYAVTYNQPSNTVLSTTTSGASYTGVYDGSYQQETFSNVAIGSFANQLVEFYNSISLLRIDVSANGGRLYFNNTTADTFEMLRFIKGGTNGGTVDFYVTSRSPLGNLIANGGGFAFRDAGVNSNFYVKRVDGGTTGWNVGITKASESSTLNALAFFDVTTGNSITDAATATLVIDTNSTALELKPVTSAGNAEVNFRTSAGFIQSQIYYDEDVSTFNIEAQSTSLNIGNFAGPIKFASSSVDSAMYLTNTYPVAVLDGNPGDINMYVNGASSEKFINKGSVNSNRVWSKFALDSDTNAYGGFGRLQNRVRWSEDLTQSTWVDGLGNTTIIPGATTGPNGELVDNVQWDSTGLGLRAGALGTVNGNNYTVSFWAKHISGTNKILIVDINDGGATGLTIDSNDWQRYHASLVAGSSGSWLDITHNGTSTFAIWGVQVNDGIEVFPYLKTEDIARKDTTDYGLAVDGKIIFSGSSVDSDHITTNLMTGVLDGGTLSINGVDDSLIDVTAGSALIVDYSTPGSPNIRPISWDAQTIDPVLGATEFIKWIGVQESATAGVGEFVFDIEFTQLEKRTIAIVGRCWGDGVTDSITEVGQYTTSATGQSFAINDLSYILGSINKRGNVFSANGANLLLDKSAGVTYRYAADHLAIPTAPHVHTDTAQTGITTYWYLQQNSLVADIQPDIDPDNWDDGGTKTAVPTGKYTLQRLYYFPVSQLLAQTYGQEIFDSMGAAIGAAGEDIVEVPDELLEGAILRGWIALKQGATALNDNTQALFKEARSIGDQPAKGTVGTTLSYRNYTVADIGASGIHYYAGFYQAPAAAVTLTIGGTVTQVYGTANIALGAHAFCVASGAGGTDLVLTVSGTSITEEGVRTPGDSEILVADTDQATTNQYFETLKFWLGQVTYTLTGAAGSFTFNYGFAKYDDFSNRDFTITDFQVIGQGAASETALDIQLLHHKSTGWTYSAGAFVPGTGFVISLANDYGTDDNLANNISFAYKRTNLSTFVNGAASEGLLVKFSTSTNNSISSATIEIGALV